MSSTAATATNIDEVYTGGTIRPIEHGTLDDLVFLKTETGAEVRRNPSFGVATAFQARSRRCSASIARF